ncbi:MAG: RimK family alpha-L-glutamate ligase [Salinigranum sp.]
MTSRSAGRAPSEGGGERSARVGIVCEPDHPVLSSVAASLRAEGCEVVFFEPGAEIDEASLRSLSLLVNKKTRPASIRALRRAERLGVPTWNGPTPTILFASRLVALSALEAVGFVTPPLRFERPPEPYVAKRLFGWEGPPELNGEGDFYQDLLPTDGTDRKYYAVDAGRDCHVAVVLVSSKLFGEKRYLGTAASRPEVERRIRRLMDITGARSLGVDLIRSRGGRVAVDVNVSPSFRHAGLEGPLADSIRDCLAEAAGK